MVELLNLSDVVILNGSAQHTCKAVRGDGIDDYLAVSCTLVERTSEMQYWELGEFETDHIAIACKIKLKTP
jgi:hypothetical protein